MAIINQFLEKFGKRKTMSPFFFTLVTFTHCLISSIHVLNDFFDYTYDVQLKQHYNIQYFNFRPLMVHVCVCVCVFVFL